MAYNRDNPRANEILDTAANLQQRIQDFYNPINEGDADISPEGLTDEHVELWKDIASQVESAIDTVDSVWYNEMDSEETSDENEEVNN